MKREIDSEKDQPYNNRGLECRRCGCRHFRVIYTRPERGRKILRRRECHNCGKRITTCEKQAQR